MRRHRLTLLIISSALAISAAAMFAHPLQDDTATLLKKEALQAIDQAGFAEGDGLLSTDYVGLRAPDGRVVSALSGASMLYTSIDGQGLQASFFGCTAVVSGIVRVNGSENANALLLDTATLTFTQIKTDNGRLFSLSLLEFISR